MKTFFKNKKTKAIVLILIMTMSFLLNIFNTNVVVSNFNDFQSDSEKLVKGKIYCNKYMPDDKECSYGLVYYDSDEDTNILEGNNLKIEIFNYESQFGLQGYVISFLHNKIHLPIIIIKAILCLLLAIVLYSISYFISIKYNKLLGWIFYLTFLLSPWVVAFGKNMYWASFTWFLPGLLGLLLSMNYDKKGLYVPLIFITVFIKCLCGYEYLSVIMLFTISFFIIDLFTEKDKKKIFMTTLIVGIACLLAFILAIGIHGYIRGNGNIAQGVEIIYQKDVLRRTIITSDKDSYDGILRESMDANIIKVLKRYVYDWYNDIVLGIHGRFFPLMMIISLVLAIKSFYLKEKESKKEIIMYIVFFVTCISWFILGKSHSYIHTHINYVLWYFGFVQIVLYLLIKNIYYYYQKYILKY